MTERREHLIKPVERRTFLRYSLFGATAGGLGVFGVGAIGFLWPQLGAGFGAKITLPVKAPDLLDQILDTKSPFEYPAGRLYVIAWDTSLPGAMEAYGADHLAVVEGNMALMTLFQKCVHLGCRVPWCQTSQWFECPCHGSKYNKYGEWSGGPAPRGLDRFPSVIQDDNLVVDTGAVLTGPPRTAKVLQQEPEGPNCVSL
jgi:cytochrome b6-f complex iron-sulfur subunit